MSNNTGRKQVTFKMPSFLWPAAVITSVILAVLEALGIARVPWFVALLPIGIVIGLALSIILSLLIVGLLIGGAVLVLDFFQKRSRVKKARARLQTKAASSYRPNRSGR